MIEKNEEKKPIYKKWWFWVIIVIVLACLSNPSAFKEGAQDGYKKGLNDNATLTNDAEIYTIVGEEIGEYGKKVILNANTDMPAEKYLYKLPAGTYVVTTNFEKLANFYIVKDEITTEEGNTEYPEVLNYVSEAYMLTNGDNDFNGKASKSVEITLGEDESIQVVGTQTIIFQKK